VAYSVEVMSVTLMVQQKNAGVTEVAG